MKKINYSGDAIKVAEEVVQGCMGDAPAYCVAECPMHTDVKGYVNLIGEKKYDEAISVIREKLFLPQTLGRICAHPCEKACKRETEFGKAVSIASLKRFAAEQADNEANWDVAVGNDTNKKVAIIGAGPAGAQAAIDLRKKGHSVTIFEKLPVVGGMMRVGIPEYRLPRDIIDFEYSYLNKLGVEIKLNTEIGKDIEFSTLENEFDAVLMAVGAHKGSKIPMNGHDAKGSYHAVEYLKEISLTQDFHGKGKKVVVIGGGDVAMDCARSAYRIGAEHVELTCLESGDAIPASKYEQEESLEEGVKFNAGWGPQEVVVENGQVVGLKVKKVLSIFDEAGNFNPQFEEGSERVIEADNVIFAVGQLVDSEFTGGKFETTRGGRFVIDQETLQTKENEKVFVAGDAGGTPIVVKAMAHARQAAESIDRYLTGKDLKEGRDFEKEGSYKTHLETTVDAEDLPRISHNMRNPEERKKDFKQADLGLTEEQAVEEASRCLKCECKICMKECMMMNDFGDCPKTIFNNFLETGDIDPLIPYSCNMCNQCTLVCPKDYPMPKSFMSMRMTMVKNNDGESPLKGHDAIKWHQKLGFGFLNMFTVAAKSKRK